MKNRNLFLMFLVSFFISCASTIQEPELVFLSGKYCDKSDSKPFSGKVISKYSSGEVEGKSIFTNGLISSRAAFGYEGELIGGSAYEQIEAINVVNKNIDRVIFVSSHEGKKYWYYSIQVIIKEEEKEYESLQAEVMKEVKSLGYLSKVNGCPLIFEVLNGELEPALFEIRIK